MADKRAEDIVRRFHECEERRVHWDNHWQEVADHCFGRRDFTVAREPGRQRNVRIYDTTALDANNLLAAALHSLLTNPATDWFDTRFGDDRLNQNGHARRYLEMVTNRLQFAFSRPNSGFAANIAQAWFDAPGFGNACIYIEDNPAFGAQFVSMPIAEMYPETDANGRVVAMFRKYELAAWKAMMAFGEDNLPKKIREDAEKPSGGGPWEFIQYVRRREVPNKTKINGNNMPWESITIVMCEKQVVREMGYRTNPYLYARWDVDTGEDFGRGPGIWSLPNAKMLNAIARTYIRGSEKTVDPPLLAIHDSVLPGSQLRITPNSVNVVQDVMSNGRMPIEYLEHKGQYAPIQFLWEYYVGKVNNSFHAEVIKAFMDPRMTATQVLEVARLSQRQLSPMLGRMEEEFLSPMIQRVWDIESRRMDFPVAPPELREAEIKLEYVGPIARAQKEQQSQAILDSFTSLQAIAQMEPAVLDNMDLDEAARALLDTNTVPQRIVRLREAVAEIRAGRQEAEAQARLEEGMVQGAESLSKLLPAISQFQQGQAAMQ